MALALSCKSRNVRPARTTQNLWGIHQDNTTVYIRFNLHFENEGLNIDAIFPNTFFMTLYVGDKGN
jgi:hypothetical protein